MLGPSVLGALAVIQLEAWQKIAADWPVVSDLDTSRLRCVSCHGSVIPLADEHGKLYHWTPDQVLAAKVLHLRAKHPGLDPDR